jgi:hypothetical protein
MHMIAQVPLPQAFVLTTPVGLGIAASGVLVGAALLLWGRWAGRAVFLVAGAGVGWWAGALLAARMQVNPLAAQVATAVAAGLLALVLAPLLWALMSGTIAGGVALYFTVLHFQPDLLAKAPAFAQSAGDVGAYCAAMADHFAKCVLAAWENHAPALATASGLAGVLPFVIGTIRLRLATIIMSSLSGGAAVAAGLACIVGFSAPSAAPVLWGNWFVVGGAAVAFAFAGVIVQYRRAIKADKDQKNREGEPPAAGKADGEPQHRTSI